MTNLKKYRGWAARIVLFLTFLLATSCSRTYHVTGIEGRELPITADHGQSEKIEAFVNPYRDHIDRELNTVLAYSPSTLDKSDGKWQTGIGNLMADAILERGNRVLKLRKNRTADICLLNFGGIRSIIPKGDVTTRTAFEIMPFENSLVSVMLLGTQIQAMADYIASERKAHPLSGMTLRVKDGRAEDIRVGNKLLDLGAKYEVITSDYLLNGGDNMTFFAPALEVVDLDYKIRNVLIDHFRDADTLRAPTDARITELK